MYHIRQHFILVILSRQVSPVNIVGPCIVCGEVKQLVCSKEPREIVKLKRDTSLEKALVLYLCVYYVKDITYLSAFRQLK